MSLRVRTRRDDDLTSLAAILVRTHHRDAYPIVATHADASWLVADVETAWVAELDGVVVGHAAVQRRAPDHLVPSRFFVDPGARGHGVGGALLDVVDAYALGARASMTLDVVDADASAIALYERRGWRRTSSRTVDWFGPDGPHPLVHTYAAPDGRHA